MKLRDKRIITISLFIVAYLVFIGFANSLIAFGFIGTNWLEAFGYLGSLGEMFSQGVNSALCGVGVLLVLIGLFVGLIVVALVKRSGKSKVWAILQLVLFAVVTLWSILTIYTAKDEINIAINDIFINHSLGGYWSVGAYSLYLLVIFFGLYLINNIVDFFFILLIKGPSKYVEVEEIDEIEYMPVEPIGKSKSITEKFGEKTKTKPKIEIRKNEEIKVEHEKEKSKLEEEFAKVVVPKNKKLNAVLEKGKNSKPRRISFEERLAESDKELRDIYKDMKAYVETYGVHSRVANSGESFRLHTICYLKITVAGKKLKLYYKLKPEEYKDSTIPLQDVSKKKIYEKTPLAFKVKSGLSIRRAKELIDEMMKKEGISKKVD